MQITRLRAKNFRSIKNLDLHLGPPTFLIGANGAGKSSVLELLHLFRGIGLPSQFVEKFSQWGGFSATVNYNTDVQEICFGFDASIGGPELSYDIALKGELNSCYVNKEQFSGRISPSDEWLEIFRRTDTNVRFTEDDAHRNMTINHGLDSPIQHLQAMPNIQYLIAGAKNISLWHVNRFQPDNKVRAPQQLQPVMVPNNDGSNLFSALYTLKTERRKSYAKLLDSLKAAVPELEELDFPLAGAGHVNLIWVEKKSSRPFYSNQLSDGILRLLWMLTVLYSAPDDGVIMFDEPELSMHPQWLSLLVGFFRDTSARTSVVVATQSAEMIRWIRPEELVVADIAEEGTIFTPATKKEDLNKWLEDFTLSELWTMGELGGRR